MSVEIFQDDDKAFREWRAKHPAGYVVNVVRGLTDRDGTIISLPMHDSADYRPILVPQNVNIRPRAIITTMLPADQE